MSKFKRALSVVLAMAMVFGMFAIASSAALMRTFVVRVDGAGYFSARIEDGTVIYVDPAHVQEDPIPEHYVYLYDLMPDPATVTDPTDPGYIPPDAEFSGWYFRLGEYEEIIDMIEEPFVVNTRFFNIYSHTNRYEAEMWCETSKITFDEFGNEIAVPVDNVNPGDLIGVDLCLTTNFYAGGFAFYYWYNPATMLPAKIPATKIPEPVGLDENGDVISGDIDAQTFKFFKSNYTDRLSYDTLANSNDLPERFFGDKIPPLLHGIENDDYYYENYKAGVISLAWSSAVLFDDNFDVLSYKLQDEKIIRLYFIVGNDVEMGEEAHFFMNPGQMGDVTHPSDMFIGRMNVTDYENEHKETEEGEELNITFLETQLGASLVYMSDYDHKFTVGTTISFDTGYEDGEDIDAISGAVGAEVGDLPVPEDREGYTFAGWDQNPTVFPGSDVTLVAQWDINKYNVTYYMDESLEDVYVLYEDVEYDSTFPVPANPAKGGYTFTGWSVDVSGIDVMPATDLEIYATWTAAAGTAYTVETYTMDIDGTYGAPATTTGYGTTGEDAEITSNPAAGFYFDDEQTNVLTAEILGDGSTVLKIYYGRTKYDFKTVVDEVETVITNTWHGAALPSVSDPAAPAGYTFAGWDAEIPATMPIGGLTITANPWAPASGTEYTVETYTMGTDGTYGAPATTTGYGTTGEDAEITANPAAGFYFDDEQANVLTAEILGDGSTVLKIYYGRTKYDFKTVVGEVETVITNTWHGAALPSVSDPAAPAGYAFDGWNTEIPAAMPIGGLTITANPWLAIEVDYTIRVYEMDATGAYAGYTDYARRGITATTAANDIAAAAGFALDSEYPVPEIAIAGDGTTVLPVHFARNKYAVNLYVNGVLSSTSDVYFGSEITSIADPAEEFIPEDKVFVNWDITLPATVPVGGMNIYAVLADAADPLKSVIKVWNENAYFIDTPSDFLVLVSGKPDKLSFHDRDSTEQPTHYSGYSSHLTYTKNHPDVQGRIVDVYYDYETDTIIYDYEEQELEPNCQVWTVTLTLTTAVARKGAMAKYPGSSWDTDPYDFELVCAESPTKAVISAESDKAIYLYGNTAIFTIKTTAAVKRIRLVTPTGSTLTYTASAANSVIDGEYRIWTISRRVTTVGENSFVVEYDENNVWAESDQTISFTLYRKLADVPLAQGDAIVSIVPQSNRVRLGGETVITVTTDKDYTSVRLLDKDGNVVKTITNAEGTDSWEFTVGFATLGTATFTAQAFDGIQWIATPSAVGSVTVLY